MGKAEKRHKKAENLYQLLIICISIGHVGHFDIFLLSVCVCLCFPLKPDFCVGLESS